MPRSDFFYLGGSGPPVAAKCVDRSGRASNRPCGTPRGWRFLPGLHWMRSPAMIKVNNPAPPHVFVGVAWVADARFTAVQNAIWLRPPSICAFDSWVAWSVFAIGRGCLMKTGKLSMVAEQLCTLDATETANSVACLLGGFVACHRITLILQRVVAASFRFRHLATSRIR